MLNLSICFSCYNLQLHQLKLYFNYHNYINAKNTRYLKVTNNLTIKCRRDDLLCITIIFIYSIHNESTQQLQFKTVRVLEAFVVPLRCLSKSLFYYNQGPPGVYLFCNSYPHNVTPPDKMSVTFVWMCRSVSNQERAACVYLMSGACDKANVICLK